MHGCLEFTESGVGCPSLQVPNPQVCYRITHLARADVGVRAAQWRLRRTEKSDVGLRHVREAAAPVHDQVALDENR